MRDGYLTLVELKKRTTANVVDLEQVSISLLGDSPTQLINTALKGYGIENNYDFSICEADYNQIDYQIFNKSSELYQTKSKYVVIIESSEKLQQKFYKLTNEQKGDFVQNQIDKIRSYIETINSQFQTTIIFSNYVEINDSIFGNYSSKTSVSFLSAIRSVNSLLQELSNEYKNLSINDLSSIQNQIGRNHFFSPVLFANSGMVHSVETIPIVAKNITDIIKSSLGKIKKCVILDLDNTLWGGIIGDDGLSGIQIGNLGIGEVFSRFQQWIKQLKDRGIILAVCSKNEEKNAMLPFQEHPDMVLKLEDIAVFVANWDNKADNIRYIQSILNIGFDSMVFFDDNPVERKIVRDNLPDVFVPELPQDPSLYQEYLQGLNLFEVNSVSNFDASRTKQYQEESKRVRLKQSYVNEVDFLKSLKMEATVSPFLLNDVPRLAQLTQRSNQFNLRTVRYSEDEVLNLMNNTDYITISFKLNDIYGDYGLVSLIILEKKGDDLFIDSWLMSCRVLKRGLESFVLNKIVEIGKEKGVKRIVGEYLKTPKNEIVKDHYKELGFIESSEKNCWSLEVASFSPIVNYIKMKK